MKTFHASFKGSARMLDLYYLSIIPWQFQCQQLSWLSDQPCSQQEAYSHFHLHSDLFHSTTASHC